MPTIKDIAREAGVSHGTVSNVINGRGNVSVEKIRLVWQAAEKLGYKVNARPKVCGWERTGQSRLCFRGSSTPTGRLCMRSFKASFHREDILYSSIPPALWRAENCPC